MYVWGRKRFAICIMEKTVIGTEGLRALRTRESEKMYRGRSMYEKTTNQHGNHVKIAHK